MLSRQSWRSSLIGAPTEPVENKVEGSVGPAVIHLPSIRLKKGPAYSAGPFFHLLLGTLLCSSCLSKPNSNPTIDRYGRVLRKPSAKRWTEVPLDHAYRRHTSHMVTLGENRRGTSSTRQGNDGVGRFRGAADRQNLSLHRGTRCKPRSRTPTCRCRSRGQEETLVGGADVHPYGRLSSSINRQGDQLADHR